ncbi:hypothetical protein AB0M54_10445 [Actinoplanes sp. NPDC051470]|uniref:hypothetical protein n=1 Tax=Actinoplanes sp. NPDC051470 TaxID=3157224 RepID=UPI003416D94F
MGWVWRRLIDVAALTGGVWVADVFVPGFRVEGSGWGRLFLGGAVAVVMVGVAVALIVPLSVIVGSMLMARVAVTMTWAPSPSPPSPPWSSPSLSPEPVPVLVPRPPGRVMTVLAGLIFAGAAVALVQPVAFKAGTWLVGRFGGPVELSGGWARWLAAGLVFSGVFGAVRGLLAPRRVEETASQWLAFLVSLVGAAGALWFAVEVLPGVRLTSGDRPVVVNVLVLASVFIAMRVAIPGGVLIQVAIDAIVLATLEWAGAWLTTPLEFSGWGWLLLAALIVTVATSPARLLAPEQSLAPAATDWRSAPF